MYIISLTKKHDLCKRNHFLVIKFIYVFISQTLAEQPLYGRRLGKC